MTLKICSYISASPSFSGTVVYTSWCSGNVEYCWAGRLMVLSQTRDRRLLCPSKRSEAFQPLIHLSDPPGRKDMNYRKQFSAVGRIYEEPNGIFCNTKFNILWTWCTMKVFRAGHSFKSFITSNLETYF